MTLKIVKGSDGQRTLFWLSGRIRSGDIGDIREQLKGIPEGIVLDLRDVMLVDRDVVTFLAKSEAEGVEVVNCSPYIRAWISRERDIARERDSDDKD
jgi:hypothetical protein